MPRRVGVLLDPVRRKPGIIVFDSMKDIDPSNGFHIYGWMSTILELSGGELLTYAIVRQFSQDDAGIYTGGIPFIAAFVGCSKETARKYLHALVEKKYIIPIDATTNGVRFVNYVADNDIPKKFGYTPKKSCEDTQKSWVGVPKKFGLEIEDKKEKYKENYPPTPQAVADYCRSRGFAYPEGFADIFLENCNNNGWRTAGGTGKPITNWKNYIVNSWERNHKNKTYPRRLYETTPPIAKTNLDNYLR